MYYSILFRNKKCMYINKLHSLSHFYIPQYSSMTTSIRPIDSLEILQYEKKVVKEKISTFLQDIYNDISCLLRTWKIKLKGCFGLTPKLSIPSDHPYRQAIQDLMEPGGEIHDTTIDLLLDKMRQNVPSLQIEQNLLYNVFKPENLSARFLSGVFHSSTILVCIPLLISLKGGNHYTMLCIDPKAKTIEYYDSTGRDRNVEPFLESVKAKYFPYDPKAIIRVNIHRAQWDDHSCGVCIIDYIQRRLQNEPCDSIFLQPKSPQEIEAARLQMAKSLLG